MNIAPPRDEAFVRRRQDTGAPSGAKPARLMSVDALRGFDMFWIMGGDYLVRSFPQVRDSAGTRALAAQMEHCEWAGFHFYDLIFPLFVFIVGVSIVFSVRWMLERDGRAATIRRIIMRSVILFVLGVLYMGGVANGFKNVYLAGVLHRIAVAYFFAALLFCFFGVRTLVGICGALLAGYWGLMTFVPVPGLDAPSLAGPGQNLAHYLDERFLPGQKFEGTLLSTLPAVANCLLGVFAGLLLQSEKVPGQRKVYWLLASGAASLALGFAWAQEFPIIKLLWTSTYVLVACGYSAILLGVFYQVVEVWQCRKWAQPFVWIGMNAITIYLVAGVVNFHRLAGRFVGGDVAILLGRYSALASSLVSLALVFWVVNFLYRRKIFLRL
jgi:predicted acyltransferase